jgi:hypothetical protein
MRECVPFLSEVLKLCDVVWAVRALTQGERPLFVKVQAPDGGQLGMVSARRHNGDIVHAFLFTMRVIRAVQADGIPVTEAIFYVGRDAMWADGRGHMSADGV